MKVVFHFPKQNWVRVRLLSQRIDIVSHICHPSRFHDVAIVDKFGEMTYGELNLASSKLASEISLQRRNPSLNTVAGLNESNRYYVISMLATWKLGLRFLPLCPTHPWSELTYFLQDSGAQLLLKSKSYSKNAVESSCFEGIGVNVLEVSDVVDGSRQQQLIDVQPLSKSGDALIMYTSGTTDRPKGVLHTDRSLNAMITAVCSSWQYSSNDKILHFLPLHHLHGVLNKLLCILFSGGCVEFSSSANAVALWKRLANEKEIVAVRGTKPLSLFMAVPTVYAKMIEAAHSVLTPSAASSKTISPRSTDAELSREELRQALDTTSTLRLMVSGSAALPDTVLDAWKKLTGHTLLERYGMTELGMVLTNPLHGERKRGKVGKPFPGVSCRIVDDSDCVVTTVDLPGELRVKGPNVFERYLNREDSTKATFDADGWFKTGDVATVDVNGDYQLLGRSSSDIIKSGGFKLSALEIERELLAHPLVLEGTVIGVPDDMLGEKVVAVVVLRDPSAEAVESDIRDFLKPKLAAYKLPRDIITMESIPRNHMGKVNKKELKATLIAGNK